MVPLVAYDFPFYGIGAQIGPLFCRAFISQLYEDGAIDEMTLYLIIFHWHGNLSGYSSSELY